MFCCHQTSDVDDLLAHGHGVFQTRITVVENVQLDRRRLRDYHLDTVSSELELLNFVIDLVNDLDPDIIVGWELQKASWGYLNARAATYG